MKCEICGLEPLRGVTRCYQCINRRYCLIAGCTYLEVYGYLCNNHMLEFDKWARIDTSLSNLKKWLETRESDELR